MQKFFELNSKGDPFRLFSGEHLITISIIVALCVLMFVFRKQLQEHRKKQVLRFSLVFILYGIYGLSHLWLYGKNAWSLKTHLPLHLSDLAVILAPIMLLTNSGKLFQFMYYAGLASSIQAILTPDLGQYTFPHVRYISFFVLHGGVAIACLFMLVSTKYRPTHRSIWVTVLIINLYTACVFFINKWLGSNYLYIMKKPGNASPLDYLGPWPWYLLSMELLMIVSFYLLYSPFWLKRKKELS